MSIVFYRHLPLILTLAMFFAGTAIADGPDRMWLKKAEQGDAFSQYVVGRGYLDHSPDPDNEKKAAHWMHKAAEQNHDEAQLFLGKMYRAGLGVPQDHKKSAHWFHEAAKQGNIESQVILGEIYRDGLLGEPQDHKKAKHWFREAAHQGDISSQLILGEMYRDGLLGEPRDIRFAIVWFRRAGDRAGIQGSIDALTHLGDIYAKGLGVPKNDSEAEYWYLEAKALKARKAKYDREVQTGPPPWRDPFTN